MTVNNASSAFGSISPSFSDPLIVEQESVVEKIENLTLETSTQAPDLSSEQRKFHVNQEARLQAILTEVGTQYSVDSAPTYMYLMFVIQKPIADLALKMKNSSYKIAVLEETSTKPVIQSIDFHRVAEAFQNSLFELSMLLFRTRWRYEKYSISREASFEGIAKQARNVQNNWKNICEALKTHSHPKNEEEQLLLNSLFNTAEIGDILFSKILAGAEECVSFCAMNLKMTGSELSQFPIRNLNSQTFNFYKYIINFAQTNSARLEQCLKEISTSIIAYKKKLPDHRISSLKKQTDILTSVQAHLKKINAVLEQLENNCAKRATDSIFPLSIYHSNLLHKIIEFYKDPQTKEWTQASQVLETCAKIIYAQLNKVHESLTQLQTDLSKEITYADRLEWTTVLAHIDFAQDITQNMFCSFFPGFLNDVVTNSEKLIEALTTSLQGMKNCLLNLQQIYQGVVHTGFTSFDLVQTGVLYRVWNLHQSLADKEDLFQLSMLLMRFFYVIVRFHKKTGFEGNAAVNRFMASTAPFINDLIQKIADLEKKAVNFSEKHQELWQDIKALLDPIVDMGQYMPLLCSTLNGYISDKEELGSPDKRFLIETFWIYRWELQIFNFSYAKKMIQEIKNRAQLQQERHLEPLIDFLEKKIAKQEKLKADLLLELSQEFSEDTIVRTARNIENIHFEFRNVIDDEDLLGVSGVLVSKLGEDVVQSALDFMLIPYRFMHMLEYIPTETIQRISSTKKAPTNVKKKSSKKKKVQKKQPAPQKISETKTSTAPETSKFDNLLASVTSECMFISMQNIENYLLRDQILSGKDNTLFYKKIIGELAAFEGTLCFPLSMCVLSLFYGTLATEQVLKSWLAINPYQQTTSHDHILFSKVGAHYLRANHHLTLLLPPDDKGCTLEFKAHCKKMDAASLSSRFPFSYPMDFTGSLLLEVFNQPTEHLVQEAQQICTQSMNYTFILWKEVLGLEDAENVPYSFAASAIEMRPLPAPIAEIYDQITVPQLLYPLKMMGEMLTLTPEERQRMPLTFAVHLTSLASLFLYLAAEYYTNENNLEEKSLAHFEERFSEKLTDQMKEHLKTTDFILKQVTRYPASCFGSQIDLFNELNFLVDCQQVIQEADKGWLNERVLRKIQRRYGGDLKQAAKQIAQEITKIHDTILQDALLRIETGRIIFNSANTVKN